VIDVRNDACAVVECDPGVYMSEIGDASAGDVVGGRLVSGNSINVRGFN
jgi:hypothetical protein